MASVEGLIAVCVCVFAFVPVCLCLRARVCVIKGKHGGLCGLSALGGED